MAGEQFRPIQALSIKPRIVVRQTKGMFEDLVALEVNFRKLLKQNGVIHQVNKEGLQIVKRLAINDLKAKIQTNRRFARTNSGRLEKALGDTRNSKVTRTGFEFLIYTPKLLKEVPYYLAVEEGSFASVGRFVPLIFLSRPNDRKGRPQEITAETSARSVTKPQAPDPTRGNALTGPRGGRLASGQRGIPIERDGRGHTVRKTDRIVGPSEIKRKKLKNGIFRPNNAFVVQIKRPVPAYHYARDAGREFSSKHMYAGLLQTKRNELEKLTGMKLLPAGKH
jgi:hypothetical protein